MRTQDPPRRNTSSSSSSLRSRTARSSTPSPACRSLARKLFFLVGCCFLSEVEGGEGLRTGTLQGRRQSQTPAPNAEHAASYGKTASLRDSESLSGSRWGQKTSRRQCPMRSTLRTSARAAVVSGGLPTAGTRTPDSVACDAQSRSAKFECSNGVRKARQTPTFKFKSVSTAATTAKTTVAMGPAVSRSIRRGEQAARAVAADAAADAAQVAQDAVAQAGELARQDVDLAGDWGLELIQALEAAMDRFVRKGERSLRRLGVQANRAANTFVRNTIKASRRAVRTETRRAAKMFAREANEVIKASRRAVRTETRRAAKMFAREANEVIHNAEQAANRVIHDAEQAVNRVIHDAKVAGMTLMLLWFVLNIILIAMDTYAKATLIGNRAVAGCRYAL